VFILIVDSLDVMCGKLDPLRRAEHTQQDRDPIVRSHPLEDPDPAGEWSAADANAVAAPKGESAPTRQVDQAVRSGACLQFFDDRVVELCRYTALHYDLRDVRSSPDFVPLQHEAHEDVGVE
jgi:hypothetical protein